MSIQRIERALLSVLSPLTGTRATGVALVSASSAPTVLPKGSYGTPRVVSAAGLGQLDPTRMVKTTEEVTCSVGGTSVPLTSVLGGPTANLPLGTVIRWRPPVTGIEETSPLSTALTGGVAGAGLGYAKKLVTFEGIGSGQNADGLWRASVGADFPAAVLSWESSSDGQAVGRGVEMREHRFRLYIVTTRFDSFLERQDEGKQLIDAAAELFAERAAVDDEVFSAPPVRLGPSGRLAIAATSHVYWLECFVSVATKKLDLRTFPDWIRTRLDAPTMDDSPLAIIDGAVYAQRPAYGQAFSKAFARVP